jgi:DNA-binding NarL/FixJ family response regulator
MNIFLVANCPFLCERLTGLLQEDGKHVVLGWANTVDAALQAVAVKRPDILMLDAELEHGNGMDVLAEAKRLSPDVLGIVVSKNLTARDRKAAIDGMAAHLIEKAPRVDLAAVV